MVTQLLWVFAMSLYLEYVCGPANTQNIVLASHRFRTAPGTCVIPLKTLLSDIYPGHVIEVDRSDMDIWVSQIALTGRSPAKWLRCFSASWNNGLRLRSGFWCRDPKPSLISY